MAKPKKFKGARITLPPKPSPTPRRKEDGRPKGTLKKYKFEQTRLGFMLKYEVPAVYEIIMRMTPKATYPEPRMRTIEVVCRASDDPALKKPKFFRYLEEYRKKGICCNRPKSLTAERAIFYTAMREKKLNQYIQRNGDKVQKMRVEMKQKSKKSHCDDE